MRDGGPRHHRAVPVNLTKAALILGGTIFLTAGMLTYCSPYRTCLRGLEGMEYTPQGHTTSHKMTFARADLILRDRHSCAR